MRTLGRQPKQLIVYFRTITNTRTANSAAAESSPMFAGIVKHLLKSLNEMKAIPTLYEWAGGIGTFETLFSRFYDQVLQDDLLGEVFKNMSAEHVKHVSHFVAEVFGGEQLYTTEDGGSHARMIGKHIGRRLTEDQRQRWVQLLLKTADEVGLKSDPEFRSAFVGYLEWGTRLAVINSRLTLNPMESDTPMPKWGWGETGGPYDPDAVAGRVETRNS